MALSKPIQRISPDGEVVEYKSGGEAARETPGSSVTLVYRAARTGIRHAGYDWRYVGADPVIKLPSVLLLDIETAPILGYFWSLYKPHMMI